MHDSEYALPQEMRKIDKCNKENCSTLKNREKAVTILGDRWWLLQAKQEGDKISKTK